MNTQHQYTLQKYAGRKTRHTCPSCGQPYCFSLYVDSNGNPLSQEIGRCDHESSCGYHKTPKDYFQEHPTLNTEWNKQNTITPTVKTQTKQQPPKQKPLFTIPQDIMQRSVRPNIQSTFTTFLATLFPQETVISLTKKYKLGVTKSRDVIYFQIDKKGNVRTGKIMKYNPKTGKRIKDKDTPFKINWVHSLMRHSGQLPQDWELTQCLFGEHLLSDPEHKNKTVALVESEKSAIIASAIMPKYIWIATGGKSQLKEEKLLALKERKIIAFPDVDAYQEWTTKLTAIENLNIIITDLLEKNATEKDRNNHIDIADWLIRWREETIKQFGSLDAVPIPALYTEKQTEQKQYENPNMQLIAKYISPQYQDELAQLVDELDLIPTTVAPLEPI